MDLIAKVAETDPKLAEDLMRLLNDLELARMEKEAETKGR